MGNALNVSYNIFRPQVKRFKSWLLELVLVDVALVQRQWWEEFSARVQDRCKSCFVEEFGQLHQYQALAYADDVNLIGDDIRPIEIKAEVLLNACKDIGLAVSTGKTKYMEIGRNRGVIANEHIKVGSNSYEKVKTFKYLVYSLTIQNSIQEEIKCRLKAGN